ncbi:MAG: hypothetical protein AAB871_03380 [Patescibacteria group bacterium]
MNYKGTIIEESLANKDILRHVKILGTKVEQTTDAHQTPWLKQWTLHKVELPEESAEDIARELSQILDYSHKSAWYADYKNSQWHYIIFKNKIFKVDRHDPEGHRQAKEYGLALGIPEHQVDFSPDIN